jgi:hypothetical protein
MRLPALQRARIADRFPSRKTATTAQGGHGIFLKIAGDSIVWLFYFGCK